LREVRTPQAKSGVTHVPANDVKAGIHYTAQMIDGSNQPAGSIAVVLSEAGNQPVLYRLCDDAGLGSTPLLSNARRVA
jgi:hypothetical protein